MEGYYIVLIATFFYMFFMGVPFIQSLWEFDYGDQPFRATIWYGYGALALPALVDMSAIFTFDGLWGSALLGIAVVMLMFAFSAFWQRHGRPYMPETKEYRNERNTHYVFTPFYAHSKAMEIAFQNVAAAAMIVGLYMVSGENVVLTGLLFAGLFLVLHVPIALLYYGPEWMKFLFVGSIFVGTIPVAIVLLVPSGLPVLFSFHVLMYLSFFIVLRRLQLRRLKQIPA